jgi:predicted dehydrogenase
MKTTMDAAVIGLGAMGGTHVGALRASPYVGNIHGYEPDPAFAALRGKELGVLATHDFESLLRNPAIKLFSIASINAVHSEQAIAALRAGKAVMCEKPMAEDLAGARAMVDAARETGGFLQIGFELRYSRIYQLAKEWIDQGRIGDVVITHCRYYCSEFHSKGTWRSESPGSLIGEKLSHYIDLQRWFTGNEVEEVFSMTAPNVVDYFNHPDNHQINMRFKNGAVADLNFSMYIAESDHRDPLLEMLEKQADDGHCLQYHIIGTKGAIETDVFRRRIRRWEFSDSPERLVSKLVEKVTYTAAEDNEWIHNVHGQNLRIIELVAKGLPPETTPEDSYETMKAGFAAELSERERRVVKMSEMEESCPTA